MNVEIMSALTPRRMREIDEQLRELKAKRATKVLLTIFYNVKSFGTHRIPQMIVDLIREIKGIESVELDTNGYITAIALWAEFDVDLRVEEIKKIPNVIEVRAEMLAPLF